MLRYENIEYLNLLYGLIPIILLMVYFRNWKSKALKNFGKELSKHGLISTFSKGRENIKFAILILCLSSIIIGISNPQIGTKMEEVKREGIEKDGKKRRGGYLVPVFLRTVQAGIYPNI